MSVRGGALERDDLEAVDFVIAFAVGFLALLAFAALSMLRGKQLPDARMSDENAKYVKVSIAPVSEQAAMKGNKTAPIPNAWQRKKPPPEALQPPNDTLIPNAISSSSAAPTDTSKKPPPPDAATPPPEEEDAASQAQPTDAATPDIDDATPMIADAELAVATDVDGATTGDGSTPGIANGTGNGLHDSYMGRYLGALQSWFTGRFYGACARLPDASKDGKHATATIHVSGRQLTSFSVSGSGDGAFDGEVNGTLSSSQGLPLPAPPDPIAAEIVDKVVGINFSCPKANP